MRFHCISPRKCSHPFPSPTLILPPLVRPAVRKHSKKGGFKANPLNISVTTSTRTYGDFSRMNPPPYTPRPTNAEKSFGRNGNGVAEEEKPAQKRPVAKWLFILGFGTCVFAFSEMRGIDFIFIFIFTFYLPTKSVPPLLAVRVFPPLQWSAQAQRRLPSREPAFYLFQIRYPLR